MHPVQIEQTVDLPHQMIGWDHLVEMKRIEKLSLLAFPTTHHAPLPQMTYLKESRIASRLNESFATLSGYERTRRGRAVRSVFDPGCVKSQKSKRDEE
jgi:hypothetical protein